MAKATLKNEAGSFVRKYRADMATDILPTLNGENLRRLADDMGRIRDGWNRRGSDMGIGYHSVYVIPSVRAFYFYVRRAFGRLTKFGGFERDDAIGEVILSLYRLADMADHAENNPDGFVRSVNDWAKTARSLRSKIRGEPHKIGYHHAMNTVRFAGLLTRPDADSVLRGLVFYVYCRVATNLRHTRPHEYRTIMERAMDAENANIRRKGREDAHNRTVQRDQSRILSRMLENAAADIGEENADIIRMLAQGRSIVYIARTLDLSERAIGKRIDGTIRAYTVRVGLAV